MMSEKMLNVHVVLLAFYVKKDNDNVLENTIMNKLQESFKFILGPIKIDNHQVYIDNICNW